MKNRIKPFIFFIGVLVFALFSCQEESQELIETSDQEQIAGNSALASLLTGTASNSGSSDNFLDNSSCFTIELPVTISIGDTVITISDEDDLDDLEDLIEDFFDGEADIEFQFPITIVFGDYSEVVIENEDQLDEFIDSCDIDDDEDIIECIDFQYPISFSIFNSAFDIIDTVVIQNDEQLYNFLDDLENDDNVVIASLNYPVTLVYTNGDTVEVNSNQELAEVLEAVGDDCDEEYPEFCDSDEVYNALVACPWELDSDNSDFEDLYLVFSENESVEVSSEGGLSGSGNWALTDNADGLVLSLSGFSDDLTFLNNEWLIVECDDDELELENGDLYFELEKDCENEVNCDLQDVAEALQTCFWSAESDLLDEEIEYLNFTDAGDILLNSEDSNDIGDYSFSIIDSQVFLDVVFTNAIAVLNGQWQVVECDDDYLSLTKEGHVLELDQECDINEGDYTCFEEAAADIVVCDEGTDGPYTFDLTVVFEDCENDSTAISYYETYGDAESATNPIANPEGYLQVDTDGTVYVRVEIGNTFEIFDIDLYIEDCGNAGSCSAEQVVEYLEWCDWTVTSFNGDDHLLIYELSFEDGNILEITNTETDEIFEGTWEVQDSGSETFLFISNVAAPDIQSINGDWTVADCSESAITLLLNETIVVIESDCN